MAKLLFVDRSAVYHYIAQVNNIMDVRDRKYYPLVKSLLEKYAPDYQYEGN